MRRVGALTLAAGGSTRFGEPKQFVEFSGASLIRRIVHAARDAGCDPIVVIAGDAIARIRDEVPDAEVIQNPEWSRGIGTSVKCGVARLRERVHAIVILACDQPLVTAETIRELMSRDARMVACSYANTVGLPALFDSRYFDALAALPDDSGAKSVLEQHRHELATIDFPGGELDIDTRADYDAIRSAGAFTFRNSSRSEN